MEEHPKRPLLLTGAFPLTIDDKNRLLVPAEVRRALKPERDGEGFFLTLGPNRKLWLYPELLFETLASDAPNTLNPDETRVQYDLAKFATASKVDWDKQARIVLPADMIRRGKLTSKEVTLVGARNHLQIWDREEWTRTQEELDLKGSELSAKIGP